MAVEQPVETVPDQMRAVVLHGPNDWSLETIDTPDTDEVEDVLCRVEAVSICGTDPKIFAGYFEGWPPSYPFIPGHEWAGTVVDIGPDVHRLDPGDRVFCETHHGCGYCEACRRGEYNLCANYGDFEAGHRQIGHTMDGAFAEYVTVPADTLFRFDESISWAEGTLLDTNSIALGCATLGEIRAGDTVAVIGTGTVGLLLVQQAKALGASEVIGIGNPDRNELAAALGADETISYHDDDVTEQVLERTDGLGVDVTLEAAGAEIGFQQAIAFTRKGGTIAADGLPNENFVSVPMADLVKKQLDLRGARAHANLSAASERIVRTGQVDVEPLITHRFDFEDFETAYETSAEGKDGAIKVVLTF